MITTNKDVAVILIGLNAKRYVLECLESIFEATWRQVTYEVIYIDNGSKDGSAEAVSDKFGESVTLIANNTNLGFCPAGNQGARIANSRYLYFINDDTLVVDDAIAITVEYMDKNTDVGTVGSRLVFPDGKEQYSGRKFPNIYSSIFGRRSVLTRVFPNFKPVTDYLCKEQLEIGEPFEVDWVSAAGQVVKKDEFFAVGGFAEDYYYWHEAVFCHRLSQTGKKIVLDPRSKIIHYEGKGSGPRPLAAQRFHIVDFHVGAFRAYCERYNLPFLSITRAFTAAALACRGAALLLLAYLKSYTKRKEA
jgi:GT2 family glycosyltransferase